MKNHKGKNEGPVIGIDLGTTFSRAEVYENGRVLMIPNEQGERLTPSYVAFNENDRLIGYLAFRQASRNSRNTIFDAKRLIGRRFSDLAVQEDIKYWPFNVESDTHDKPVIVAEYKGIKERF